MDLVPLDWAVPAVARLFQERFSPGRVYQVCAGRKESLTLRELVDWTLEIFERHPLSARWGPIRLPEIVSVAEYEAYAAKVLRSGDALHKELLRVLGYFLPHLGIFQAFENRKVLEGLGVKGPRVPPMSDYYAKVVTYLIETDWGRWPSRAGSRSS